MTERRRHIGDLPGEIQDLFADLWHVPRYPGSHRGFRPQCDCYRTDDPPTLHVVVELPGVDPASVEVLADGHALLVSGTRERLTVERALYHQMEIDYGPFERRIDVVENVDTSRASATYDAGMLHIVLPLAPAPPHRQSVPIEVERE